MSFNVILKTKNIYIFHVLKFLRYLKNYTYFIEIDVSLNIVQRLKRDFLIKNIEIKSHGPYGYISFLFFFSNTNTNIDIDLFMSF